MSDLVVETHDLRKVFRDRGRRIAAVDGLDLAVERGGVHGFLGPNGSGKTTTIRMLLGLARPDAGEIRLFGGSIPAQLPTAMRRIGAVVEFPQFSPDLSGRRNLQLLARAAGLPGSRADAVLEQVGLTERARSRFRGYSFGMRQRLGLAAALLKEPDLLILDEPLNGLDPAGITDMRELITRLGASGVTVLLSSHVLAEVQQVCSSVSIIGDGRLLASGRVADLLGEDTAHTRVGVVDPRKAAEVLTTAGYSVTRDGEELLVQGHEHPEQITRALAAQGLYVTELTAVRPDLESFFLALTGHRPRPEDGHSGGAGDGTGEGPGSTSGVASARATGRVGWSRCCSSSRRSSPPWWLPSRPGTPDRSPARKPRRLAPTPRWRRRAASCSRSWRAASPTRSSTSAPAPPPRTAATTSPARPATTSPASLSTCTAPSRATASVSPSRWPACS
jgi:ABC-2 type transport system ATP-binding protein